MTPVDMTTDTKAMILAAGYGTRMMPLSRHLPKPLLPVLGKPVINHQASLLAAAGIHEAVVNIHHLGGLIRQHVAENGLEGLRVEFSDETTELLGTGGGLKKALAIIGRESTIILINGDTILEYDIGILIAFHRKMRSAVTLLLKDVPGTPDEHAVWMDSDGLVKRFAGLVAYMV
jgi:NDP-sugar pyrophosphorylase family protein